MRASPVLFVALAALLSLLPRTSRTQYKQCMAKESDAAAAAAAAAAAIGGPERGGFGSTCGIERVNKEYKLTGGGASN
jgi:hypothetical protein